MATEPAMRKAPSAELVSPGSRVNEVTAIAAHVAAKRPRVVPPGVSRDSTANTAATVRSAL
jgi:hypothetical protein